MMQLMLCAGLCGLLATATLAAESASTTPAAGRPLRLACVGDSLTSGYKMEKPELDAYPAQLARLLGTGYDVRAFAVPGRTALRKADLALWKEQLFADAQAWQPDVVVICLGANDSWPAIWQKYGGQFAGDLRAMVEQFTKLPSHPRVWLCVPTPFFCDNIEVQQQIMTQEVNPAIRKVARETNSGLIDLYTPLAGHVELFMDDKVHPLPGAAAVMARTIAGCVQRRTGDATQPTWALPTKRDVIVCLGDSITDGYTFGQIMIQALRDSGKPTPAIICAGAGGHTLTQMAARFARDVAPYHPRIVTVNAGTNDVGRGVTPEAYEQTLRDIVAKAKAIDAHLVFFTPCMIKNTQSDARAQQYSPVLRKVAAETGCLVAEDYALMCQARSCGHEILVVDGIHPNYLGQSLMARALLDVLGYPAVPLPTVFSPSLFPGVVTAWQMRVAPLVNGKPQVLDAASVHALQPDATWIPYTLPDPAPVPAASAADWMEQARRNGFGQLLRQRIGQGRVQAVTTVMCSSARKVFINTGAAVATVWLNGEKLYEDQEWTGYHAGKERLPARLHKGPNTLVIEIAGEQFFLSVTNELIWEKSLASAVPNPK